MEVITADMSVGLKAFGYHEHLQLGKHEATRSAGAPRPHAHKATITAIRVGDQAQFRATISVTAFEDFSRSSAGATTQALMLGKGTYVIKEARDPEIQEEFLSLPVGSSVQLNAALDLGAEMEHVALGGWCKTASSLQWNSLARPRLGENRWRAVHFGGSWEGLPISETVPTVQVKINGRCATALIDTGDSLSRINISLSGASDCQQLLV